MIDVAVATCLTPPEPDPDEEPLLRALQQRGLRAATWSWDDPACDFAQAKMTLLRSTWNYPRDVEGFVRWVDRTAAISDLVNAKEWVHWNHHKGYLLELEKRGVPIVPTELVTRGASEPLMELRRRRAWDEVVVKPAVSAASFRTQRARDDASHFNALVAERDALVQPYMISVEGHGERSIMFINGELTHSVRKSARFGGEHESVSEALPVSEAEAALAHKVLGALSKPWPELLYARIDVTPDEHGELLLMELELIEPSLFLLQHPPALDRLVEAVAARL